MHSILYYSTVKFCINIHLHPNLRTCKTCFHSTKQLITILVNIQFFIEKQNFRKIIFTFSPKYNLHVRTAWIITRPVINIACEYFRNRTNPYLHTAPANRLVVICTPATLIETRYIPNYSHCAALALSHYRFNVRIPFICRAKLFNQPG